MCHYFCCCGYIFRKINDTSRQDFPLWYFFWYFSSVLLKLNWKMSSEMSLFPGLARHFFLFLYLCHLPATCYSWVLFSKQKVVHYVLSFWLICVRLRSYMLILFSYLRISSQIEPDVTLSYHCMQTLELVQTKNSISSHLVRFSSVVLNLRSKV